MLKVNFELSAEIRAVKDLVKKFGERRLMPITEKDYEAGITRLEIVEEMGSLGFFGCLIPEEYGGTSSGYLAGVVITETLAKINASYAGCTMAQLAGPPLTLLTYGTDKQKKAYIPGIVKGKLIALFGATEPDAGSDISAMRSVAVEKRNCYVINGVKNWITNATNADVGLIWVYTDKEKKHRGISCFIIDMKTTMGITARKTEKLGLRCSEVGELVLEDVEIPKENLLGKLGQGFEILMFTLGNTRLFAAARALGVGEICLEESLRYAAERVQFGKPIGELQSIQNQLVEMHIEHEAAKLLVYQVAINKDKGIHDITELATAKLFACEAGTNAALSAMRIFSSYGFSLEYPIHRYVRDALAFPITEGTSNIQKVIIARNILRK
jgi:glutaryl-CoA dehydrogenase (non-decarboxylating)